MRPGVELEPWVRLRHQLREHARGHRLGVAGERLVSTVGRGLADRDERLRVSRLDSLVRRRSELRVRRRRDDLAACVELRREELAEVRLVPDPVEADERIARVPPRVPGPYRPCELA